jgi:hypothetical protein
MAIQKTRLAGGAAGLDKAFPGGNSVETTRAKSAFQATNRARRQRLVEQLHRLGPSPLFHFIRDIERGSDIDATLEIYAELPGDLIRAYGGDLFSPTMHVIDGGRP